MCAIGQNRANFDPKMNSHMQNNSKDLLKRLKDARAHTHIKESLSKVKKLTFLCLKSFTLPSCYKMVRHIHHAKKFELPTKKLSSD